MGNSFYGGKKGRDFEIKKTFRNKCALKEDLKATNSQIKLGEFVVISYGNPTDSSSNYKKNLQEDQQEFKATYNGTLWEKQYKEIASNAEDFFTIEGSLIGYQLITSVIGITPIFVKENGEPGIILEEVPAQNDPSVSIDQEIPSFPKMTVQIPSSWKYSADVHLYDLAENIDPEIIIPSVRIDENLETGTRTFNFNLPKGTQWFQGTEITGDNSSAIITGARDGDFYLNISNNERDNNSGNVYKLKSNYWEKIGNIRGNDGNGIASIEVAESSADDGENKITINYTDSATPSKNFVIKNGAKGSTGDAAGFAPPTVTKNPIALSPDDQPVIKVTASGPDTAKVFDFDFQIAKGDPGKNFTIKGYYNTEQELKEKEKNPIPGDVYGIGVEPPYNLYIYDGISKNWINNGHLQGPPGESIFWGDISSLLGK